MFSILLLLNVMVVSSFCFYSLLYTFSYVSSGVHIHTAPGCMSGNGSAASQRMSDIFTFARSCQTVVQSGCGNLHPSSSQAQEFQMLTLVNTLQHFDVSYLVIPVGVQDPLTVALICISCRLSTFSFTFSLLKSLFQFLAHFPLGDWSFSYQQKSVLQSAYEPFAYLYAAGCVLLSFNVVS